LSETKIVKHTNFNELVKIKIPSFGRRGAGNNKAIIKIIALEGPLLKYDVSKSLNLSISDYGTISRRIDALKKAGYLEEAGKRATRRGKQTKQSMYGLTWRGFIASLAIKEVREKIVQVLERNPLLTFPEKDTILVIIEELTSQQELEIVTRTVLVEFLRTIPNLEFVENDPMNIFAWLLSSIREIKFPEGFKLSKLQDEEGLLKLLDNPAILRIVKEKLIPVIKVKTMETKAVYQLFQVLDEIGEFIRNLEVEDQPSEKIKLFFENELKPKLEKLSEEDN